MKSNTLIDYEGFGGIDNSEVEKVRRLFGIEYQFYWKRSLFPLISKSIDYDEDFKIYTNYLILGPLQLRWYSD